MAKNLYLGNQYTCICRFHDIYKYMLNCTNLENMWKWHFMWFACMRYLWQGSVKNLLNRVTKNIFMDFKEPNQSHWKLTYPTGNLDKIVSWLWWKRYFMNSFIYENCECSNKKLKFPCAHFIYFILNKKVNYLSSKANNF